MGDGAVVLAYLHPNRESHSFTESLSRLVNYDVAHNQRVVRTGGPFMFRCGPGGLVEARNKVAATFLDETDHEWLWMVDSDMGFAPDTVDRLVAAAHPSDRPIVGGLCFALKETAPDGMGGWRTAPVPTLYDWARRSDGEFGFTSRPTYEPNALTQVAGTGAACLLVHRDALGKIRAEHGDSWFDQVRQSSGQRVAEDLSFCYRAGTAGIPILVHTGVRTTHHKECWVGEADYQRARRVPPATEAVDVIVPVLGRPHNAAPFMTSLMASTGLARAHAVVQDGDDETRDAWVSAGALVLPSGQRTTFAEKVNLAMAGASPAPWVFLTGDDVAFHPGWLDHAQHAAAGGAHVIGTNDLANPRVQAGEHATHMLIRRSYIADVGASWDGPGVVCHEGYAHWYCDDEIVTAARQRGVWAMAIGSIVEHHHPAWGTAAMDDTYALGQSHAADDKARFTARLERHAA